MKCPCGSTLVPVPTCPACGEQWINETTAKALDVATEPHVIEERRKRIILRRATKAVLHEFCSKCGAEGVEPHRGECLPPDSRDPGGIGEGQI